MVNKKIFVLFFIGIFLISVLSAVPEPIKIRNCQELQDIENYLVSWNYGYDLENDIDCSDTINWNGGAGFNPIGDSTYSFDDSFYGGGYSITDLYINRPSTDGVGLFGWTRNAKIYNVNLVNVDITGNNYVGGLIGANYVDSYDSNPFSVISDSYLTGSVTGNDYVGGLGGVVYYGGNGNKNILDSYSKINVIGNNQVGGFVGYSENGIISNSYSTGSVTGSLNTGGFVGHNKDGTISNSYSTGSVSGSGNYVGGFVGHDENGIISNSYSNGSVSGSGNYVGGFVGDSVGGSCTNDFWDKETSGKTTSGVTTSCGIGKTTAEMKQESTFTSWDFWGTWGISSGFTYPCLFDQLFGAWMCLGVIGNYPPNMNAVSISPSNPGQGNTLEGICKASDIDNSQLTYSYKWYLNNILHSTGSAGPFNQGTQANVANISGSLVSTGQNWKLNCSASDGTVNSSWMNSSTVKISTSSVYWSPYYSGITELITPPSIIKNLTKPIYLVLENPPSIPNDEEWRFEIYEDDTGTCVLGVGEGCDDKIRTDANALIGIPDYNGKKIIAAWTPTQADFDKANNSKDIEDPYDFYFSVKNYKILTGNVVSEFGPFDSRGNLGDKYLKIEGEGGGAQIPTCSDGIKNQDETGIDCGGNSCPACTVTPQCIETVCSDYKTETACTENLCNLGPQNINCADPNIECGCLWNSITNSCSSYSKTPSGTCTFQEDVTSTCEDVGYLEYFIKAIWNGSGTAEANNCIDGKIGPITCSAKTRVPLENKFGIL